MPEPSGAASAADVHELEHFRSGGRYFIDGRKRKRFERLGWVRVSPTYTGFEITSEGRAALAEYSFKEPK